MTDKEIKNEIVEEDKVETPIETDTKTMSENYETIKATCDAMTSDFERFNSKKIKACGQRVRSNLVAPETPNDLLVNNSIPVKKVRKPRRANKKKVFE